MKALRIIQIFFLLGGLLITPACHHSSDNKSASAEEASNICEPPEVETGDYTVDVEIHSLKGALILPFPQIDNQDLKIVSLYNRHTCAQHDFTDVADGIDFFIDTEKNPRSLQVVKGLNTIEYKIQFCRSIEQQNGQHVCIEETGTSEGVFELNVQ